METRLLNCFKSAFERFSQTCLILISRLFAFVNKIKKNVLIRDRKNENTLKGQQVFLRNNTGQIRLKAAVISKKTGPVYYDVQVGNDVKHRHAFQLHQRKRIRLARSEEEEFKEEI